MENSANSLLKKTAFLPLFVTIFLIILKIYGYIETNSLSIFSSLADSFLDILISSINLLAIFYALKPADEDHRFGHTAIEDIAGLAQAAFLTGSGMVILLEGINRFFNPIELEQASLGITIMLAVIAITLALVIIQKYVARKTNSLILQADSLHYETDVLMNLAIIIALYFGKSNLDIIIAICISFYIGSSAFKIGKKSFDNLMDKEMPEEMKNRIYETIRQHEEIKGFHQLKTRFSGRKIFIQMHVELDRNLSLSTAHKITDKLEQSLIEQFSDAEVIIHQDPI